MNLLYIHADYSNVTRVFVFIDGSNVWHGQHHYSEAQGRKLLLDYDKLVKHLANGREVRRTIYYCSVPDRPDNSQVKFNEYLRNIGFLVIEKKLKERIDSTTGMSIKSEKGLDVSLAVDLLGYAWEDAYDDAILISGDEDYVGAVQKVMQKGKNVEVVAFRGSLSSRLRQECRNPTYIDDLVGIIRLDRK